MLSRAASSLRQLRGARGAAGGAAHAAHAAARGAAARVTRGARAAAACVKKRRRRCAALALALAAALAALAALTRPPPLVPTLQLPSAWPACAAAGTHAPSAASLSSSSTPPLSPPAATAASAAAASARARPRYAILSTYPPTKCGLATFAANLRRGLLDSGAAAGGVDVIAVHVRPEQRVEDYPPEARRVRMPARASGRVAGARGCVRACCVAARVACCAREPSRSLLRFAVFGGA
jgi:hypothetical protein